MAYERINWQNGEVGNTPLNANNLNRMDMTLEEHDQKIGDHDYEIENLKTGEQGITEELNKKMDRINPQGSGTFSIQAVNADNITAQTVEADEIKVAKVGSKGGTAPVVFDNDILVNGITTPIGSLASSASAKAESAERIANEADREAGTARTIASTAYSRVQENIFRTDKLEGIVGGGVGESIPQYTYYNGKYLRPDGEIANYNDSARVIEFEINKNSDSGCNVIFKNVDLIPTDASILCGFYNAAGILLGEEMRGLIIMADFDEDTGKMTRQYISYCVVPAPYYAKYVRISGIANGVVDIAVQTTLSDAVAELQSRSTSALVLTNPSPLPATDGKKILGIDALGKSWQGTTDNLASGNVTTTDIAIYINLGVGTYRVSANGTLADGNWYVGAWNESGSAITSTAIVADGMALNSTSTWLYGKATAQTFEFTVKTACRVRIGKLNANNTIPLVVVGITPTPTNPIPIVDASEEVVAIGKNLLDVSQITDKRIILDNGSINTNDSACASDFIKLESGQYTFASKKTSNTGTVYIRVHAYDSDKNWMQMIFKSTNAYTASGEYVATFTMPTDAKYIRICWYRDYAGSQLELGTTATSYVPYKSNSASLPFDSKSVGSAANELIVYEDGSAKIIQRVKTLDLANLEWNWNGAFNAYACDTIADIVVPSQSAVPYILWEKGTARTYNEQATYTSGMITVFSSTYASSGKRVLCRTTSADSSSERPSGTIYYALATPIETPLTAEEVAAVRQLMTYKGTTAIESEMDVVSVTYSGDIKAYIDYRINQIINPTALNEVAPMNLDETEE